MQSHTDTIRVSSVGHVLLVTRWYKVDIDDYGSHRGSFFPQESSLFKRSGLPYYI